MRSRMKGIETLRWIVSVAVAGVSLDMLSRLKGIETVGVDIDVMPGK